MAELILVVEFDISPDGTDAFKLAAAPVIAATDEEPGTLRYDWHLSDDGRRDLNLERFEDSAAFVVHDRHVAPIVPPISEVARLRRFCVMGDPSDEARTQLAATDVQYYRHLGGIGRRHGGSLTLLVDVDIKPGRLEDFKAAALALVDLAETEPGTLGYDWWISEDDRRVRIIEVFTDGAAYAAHAANIAADAPALLDTCDFGAGEIVGDPGQARAALTRPTRTFFSYFDGIRREGAAAGSA